MHRKFRRLQANRVRKMLIENEGSLLAAAAMLVTTQTYQFPREAARLYQTEAVENLTQFALLM